MTKYIKYKFENTEPIRVADDSISQSNQVLTLKFIPGTAIRGVVVNTLAQDGDFEEIKKELFSNKVRFLNAYPATDKRELIPSPKGFYEDKTLVDGKKKIENVVIKGDFSDGYKRASLGRFSYIEDGCIKYYNVDTDSDLKIKINIEKDEKKNVFRNEYITPHHLFTGYIAVEDDSLAERIKKIFGDVIFIGNARSAGMGKCRILSCEYTDMLPYSEYLPDADQNGECYLMLLSHTTMRNDEGEYCGIDWKALEKKMGVEELEVAYCSTSTVEVRGYNRLLGLHSPIVRMYEQGSVFHLTFKGVFKKEVLYSLVDEGIGVRRNEGFGRILFLKNYDRIQYKMAGEAFEKEASKDAVLSADDIAVLQHTAKAYYRRLLEKGKIRYIVNNPIKRGTVSNSQLGQVDAILTAYQYDTDKAIKTLNKYFGHKELIFDNSRVHKSKGDFEKLDIMIDRIIHSDVDDLLDLPTKNKDKIMGIPREEILDEKEIRSFKMELIIALIRYDNKKGD